MIDATIEMPPQDIEAEQALLGAMIGASWPIEAATAAGLTARHFARDDHKLVFEAITRLADDGPVDELMVVQRLRSDRTLTAAGGAVGVMALYERTPSVANSRAYIAAVKRAAVRRALVKRGNQISQLGYQESPDSSDALVAEAGRIVDEMSERVGATQSSRDVTTAADELMPFVEALQERLERGAVLSGLSTGLSALDERTCGLKPGELTIIAGRPGMGKSALAMTMAESMVFGSGADVYSVNLEMRERQQIGRLMARHGALRLAATRGLPTDADVEGAATAALGLHEALKRLHMDPSSDLTITQIRQRARRLQRRLRREGRDLKLIVVDYLQLITPPAGERNETAALTLISRGLKSMALELGVHVIALSQLNRSVEDRQPPRPRLSDLRGSGSIEQDADTVLFLFRADYYLKDDTPVELVGQAELISAKMREGSPGTDLLRWRGERVLFEDWTGPEFRVGGAA